MTYISAYFDEFEKWYNKAIEKSAVIVTSKQKSSYCTIRVKLSADGDRKVTPWLWIAKKTGELFTLLVPLHERFNDRFWTKDGKRFGDIVVENGKYLIAATFADWTEEWQVYSFFEKHHAQLARHDVKCPDPLGVVVRPFLRVSGIFGQFAGEDAYDGGPQMRAYFSPCMLLFRASESNIYVGRIPNGWKLSSVTEDGRVNFFTQFGTSAFEAPKYISLLNGYWTWIEDK